MQPKPHDVLVEFAEGEPAVLRQCASKREALDTLRYERSRSSWPLSIVPAPVCERHGKRIKTPPKMHDRPGYCTQCTIGHAAR